MPELTMLPLARVLRSPANPRRTIDAFPADDRDRELCASVKEHGVLLPLLVRPKDPAMDAIGASDYELVAGERRWRAAVEAGLAEVPVLIRVLSDAQAAEIRVIENLQRKDLDPVEEARAFQQLLELHDDAGQPLYPRGAEGIAERIGKDGSYVRQRLGLLKLPAPVQDLVSGGKVPFAQARVLTPYGEYPAIMDAVQKQVSAEKIRTEAEMEEAVHGLLTEGAVDYDVARDIREEGERPKPLSRPLSKRPYGRSPAFDVRAIMDRDWSSIGQHPGAGPCTGCPHRKEIAVLVGQKAKEPVCLLPPCWERKQKTAQAEARKEATPAAKAAKADPNQVNIVSLGKHAQLTKDTSQPSYYSSSFHAPLFDVKICRTQCPHDAHRKAYRTVDGKPKPAGEVCLKPEHFQELQGKAAAAKVRSYKEGLLANAKGWAKQAQRGLTAADYAELITALLDETADIYVREVWDAMPGQGGKIPSEWIIREALGIKSLKKKDLADMEKRELEHLCKFVLLLGAHADRRRG